MKNGGKKVKEQTLNTTADQSSSKTLVQTKDNVVILKSEGKLIVKTNVPKNVLGISDTNSTSFETNRENNSVQKSKLRRAKSELKLFSHSEPCTKPCSISVTQPIDLKNSNPKKVEETATRNKSGVPSKVAQKHNDQSSALISLCSAFNGKADQTTVGNSGVINTEHCDEKAKEKLKSDAPNDVCRGATKPLLSLGKSSKVSKDGSLLGEDTKIPLTENQHAKRNRIGIKMDETSISKRAANPVKNSGSTADEDNYIGCLSRELTKNIAETKDTGLNQPKKYLSNENCRNGEDLSLGNQQVEKNAPSTECTLDTNIPALSKSQAAKNIASDSFKSALKHSETDAYDDKKMARQHIFSEPDLTNKNKIGKKLFYICTFYVVPYCWLHVK